MERIEIQIARKFHKVYEKLAPEFGYTTRPETREFDENSSNGKLMIAVCKEVVLEELDKAREEGRKEGDIASDFLYWHPLVGGMPDSSIRIGVEFEVGGCYEDWGFVIEQYGKTISSGRTLKEAISKLTTK